MFGYIVRFLASCVAYLGGLLFPKKPVASDEPKDPLPPARVAVVGAGVGGCCAAYFLRQLGGQALDLHVYQRPGCAVGGRTAVVEFCGHVHESGASIIHSSNKYLVDFAKQFGLETKNGKDQRTTPLGIYNGKSFVFRTGNWSFINTLKSFWHYGITLLRVNSYVNSMLSKFISIYDLQAEGKAFKTVPAMLEDMGGEEFFQLTQVTSQNFYRDTKGWSEKFINELMTAALHDNYDQTTKVDAFTTLVALVAMSSGDLWSVVGGNRQIPVNALKESNAVFHEEEVLSVTRVVTAGKVSYSIKTSEGGSETESAYDVVIIANPLNLSKINFNEFPNPIYTNASTTPYQQTIANFIRGEINPAFFGATDYGHDFPLSILTTELEGSPFVYRTSGVNVPSELSTDEGNEFLKPLYQDPVRTWKVFSPEPLTREQKEQMFSRIDDEVTVDWLAYPVYNPPEEFPPFVLDDGVFYINAIEKAASAMEMSAIGGKNAALLARDYLLSRDQ